MKSTWGRLLILLAITLVILSLMMLGNGHVLGSIFLIAAALLSGIIGTRLRENTPPQQRVTQEQREQRRLEREQRRLQGEL